MKKVIATILGHDRPGIVAAVSKILFEQNCNIENVSQTTLQSEFAGLFIVSVPTELSADDLLKRLDQGLKPFKLHVHLKPFEPRQPKPPFAKKEPFIITTTGPDRKGLVAEITEIMAGYGVNITNLKAVFKGGEDPAKNMMIYEIDVPADTDPQLFYKALRKKSQELGLEISIQHRKIFETINRI